jgi:allophanate hydrolase subunit 1
MAQTSLAPLAEGGTGLTNERAAELLLIYQRYADAAKQVEANLRDYAARNGGIRDPKTGRVWLPVVCQGRESVSVERVRKAFGPDAEKVITQGKPYEQFRWTNGART